MMKLSRLETIMVEYHKVHDPVFRLVAEHITNPDVFRRELTAAQMRYEALMAGELGFNPIRPDWMDEMMAGDAPKAPEIPQTIQQWQKVIHAYAVEKGWWLPEKARSFGDHCALFASEVSEAYAEFRDGHAITEVYENPDKPGKWEGVPVELADVVIRILDFCEASGIDLQHYMLMKHQYNLTRPYRHGNKVT